MRLQRARVSTLVRKRATEPKETVVEIEEEFITLGQLLKLAGLIATGGEARYYLSSVPITVNGESEQRRGRKLRPGDRIVAPGSLPILIVASPGVSTTP